MREWVRMGVIGRALIWWETQFLAVEHTILFGRTVRKHLQPLCILFPLHPRPRFPTSRVKGPHDLSPLRTGATKRGNTPSKASRFLWPHGDPMGLWGSARNPKF